MTPGPSIATRLDVWLWRARLFKSRSLAAGAIAAGAVRVGRNAPPTRITRPAFPVAAGDILVFANGEGRVVDVQILALGVRRGPPAEARALYRPILRVLDEA